MPPVSDVAHTYTQPSVLRTESPMSVTHTRRKASSCAETKYTPFAQVPSSSRMSSSVVVFSFRRDFRLNFLTTALPARSFVSSASPPPP